MSMSTTSASPVAGLHKFFVYAPDKTDPEAFARRLAVRARHLEGARRGIDEGSIRIASALLTPESILAGQDRKMIGSTFVFEAPSIDVVKKTIEEDVYYKEGVWDPERIVILPMAPATPIP